MASIIIDRRYCGPPNSGNGGYVCGRLAQHIPGAAEITLRAPPPLEKPLDVVRTEGGPWELRDGDTILATGRAASGEPTHLENASFDEARAAEMLMPIKPHEHLLPTCFVCGPARAQGDGLRISVAPLAPQSREVHAATWIPDPTLAAEDGFVAPEFLWAALDCPTGYASNYNSESRAFDQTPILLGRMSAWIKARPRPGERCVVTAWGTGRDGRKRFAEAAVFGEAGTLLGRSRATWIEVERQVQLG